MKMLLAIVLLALFSIEGFSQSNCNEENSLISVRKRKVGRTEYVIFTLKKPVTGTYTIANANPPFIADGSGNTVSVRGCKFKLAAFKNVTWQCKVKEIYGTTTIIRQVKRISQFEGNIDYAIGYKCGNRSVVNYEYDDGDMKKVVVRVKPL